MQFDNLDSEVGQKKFNGYLTTRSYVEGYSYSNADLTTFKKCAVPDASKFPHMYRWYVHIAALLGVRVALSGVCSSSVSASPSKSKKKAAPVKDEDEDDDDDDDLFGDDDDEASSFSSRNDYSTSINMIIGR